MALAWRLQQREACVAVVVGVVVGSSTAAAVGSDGAGRELGGDG